MSKAKSIWIVLYVLGLILPPPIHFHDRLFFASEYLLLPVLVDFGFCLLTRKVEKPSWPLVFVWGASFIAFFAGMFRGDMALKISIYDLGPYKYFSFKDDGVFFLRMMIIFSTPWLLRNFFRNESEQYFPLFIKTFKISLLISAVLAILDYKSIHLINLENLGYYNNALYEWWAYRAHGTFLTPIEASFIYGAGVVYLLTGGESLRNPLNAITLTVTFVALILTHGGTAFIGLIVALGAFFYFERSKKTGYFLSVLGILLLALLVGYFALPHIFFHQKIEDFIYRQKTYWQYLAVLKENPMIGLWGIGFSRICTDNNFIGLVVQGGVLLLFAALNWIFTSIKKAPLHLRYIFIFWVVTWASFDSIGYWGIGRLCWFLLGF